MRKHMPNVKNVENINPATRRHRHREIRDKRQSKLKSSDIGCEDEEKTARNDHKIM